uniref:EKC/KEOPS complex subunit LAGE3 isoform X2 n=1 Tax=Jaculus jaculus TaxID=51337 RepID=UPI001E1B2A26|nr:EKC/KEOPS complex subunit LAGE3 isoform X2 [Jaculus jaculus]
MHRAIKQETARPTASPRTRVRRRPWGGGSREGRSFVESPAERSGAEGGAAGDMRAADAGVGEKADGCAGRGVRCGTGGAPHPARAPQALGSGASPAPSDHRPGIRPHRFALNVPFPTPLEAEIACGSLAPDTEPHQGQVGKELKVSGSILAVHWNAEDTRLLRISIMNFLDQLSLVVKTMQQFGPPAPR